MSCSGHAVSGDRWQNKSSAARCSKGTISPAKPIMRSQEWEVSLNEGNTSVKPWRIVQPWKGGGRGCDSAAQFTSIIKVNRNLASGTGLKHTALPKAKGAVTLLPLSAVDAVPSLVVLGQTREDKKGVIQMPRHNQCQFRHLITVNLYKTCYPVWSSHIPGDSQMAGGG